MTREEARRQVAQTWLELEAYLPPLVIPKLGNDVDQEARKLLRDERQKVLSWLLKRAGQKHGATP